jgi:putative transposase
MRTLDQLGGPRVRRCSDIWHEPAHSISVTVRPSTSVRCLRWLGALNQIRQKRGTPKLLFCDNGSEFTSQIMDLWAYHSQVQIDFSRPGKPTDNAHVESFNGTLRAECLDVHWFATLTEAKQVIEDWRREYNESRPHRSLGERTPSEFACQIALNGDLPSSQTVGNSP